MENYVASGLLVYSISLRMRPTPPQKIRILIADDHAVVRVGITSVLSLEVDIEIVAEAATGEEAVALFKIHQPDAALFDVRMPGMGGIEAVRQVRAEFPAACIVMLSTAELDEEVAAAEKAGARGYINKTSDSVSLAQVIRNALCGQLQFSASILQRLNERAQLAPRELQVLAGMSAGLSNKEIASKLYLSTHTVKTYVKGVLEKLGTPDRAGAVTEGYKRGILKV